MDVCYERLRPSQLVARREACPIAWLPCGILEWHGRHNPIGLDGVKAHALCVRLASALGGLVWPTLWYGDNRDDILENVFTPERFNGLSHDHRPEVAAALGLPVQNLQAEAARCRELGGWQPWTDLLCGILHQISAYGFEQIVVLCGHYPLKLPADAALEAYQAASDQPAKVHALIEAGPLAERGFHGDHAARWETSLLLALTPELVDLDELRDETEEVLGVLGEDPRRATAEYGEAGIAALMDVLRAKLGLSL